MREGALAAAEKVVEDDDVVTEEHEPVYEVRADKAPARSFVSSCVALTRIVFLVMPTYSGHPNFELVRGKVVEDDDVVTEEHEPVYEVRADKARSARDEDTLLSLLGPFLSTSRPRLARRRRFHEPDHLPARSQTRPRLKKLSRTTTS
jgi:phosphoribosylaminoimidazole carboxylase (NCAIR synthetase)